MRGSIFQNETSEKQISITLNRLQLGKMLAIDAINLACRFHECWQWTHKIMAVTDNCISCLMNILNDNIHFFILIVFIHRCILAHESFIVGNMQN